MWKKVILFAIIFFCVFAIGQSVLTGFSDTKDLTLDPNFGCRWFGGESSKLECSCLSGHEEYFIKEKSIPAYDVFSITLSNCAKIHFGPNAIFNMRSLRVIELKNITSLLFDENSLNWKGYTRNREEIIDWDSNIPSLKISIEKSTIQQISSHAIKGRINRLIFTDVTIENIAPFGFSSLEQNLAIIFDRVEFKQLPMQSFKKFSTDNLIIRNSVFATIPSRTFYDIVVKQQFALINVTIDTLRPSGFIIINPRVFEITDCYINHLNGEGFKVTTRGSVLIKNNVFNDTGVAAFRAITLNKEDEHSMQTILFENNIFHTLNKDSLVVDETSFIPKFNNLQLSEVCECNNLERYFRNGENTYELKCRKDNEWITVNDFKSRNCSIFSGAKSATVYIIAGVCAILLVLVLSGLIIYFKKVHKCGSYGRNEDDKQGKLSMIVPDGRTYRETELHVIVERADLLTTDL